MKKVLKVFEPTFGASTSAEVTLVDGVVTSVKDTSTHETNYAWDGWWGLDHVKGMTLQELKAWASVYFATEDYGDRTPYVKVL